MGYREIIYKDFSSMLERVSVSKDETKEKEIVFRYFKRNYLPFMPENKDAAILDLGCGRGLFINACHMAGYSNVTGVDISPSNIEYCKKQGYECIEQDALEYLAERKDSFDVIIWNDVIEHLYKDEIVESLIKIKSSLRDKGRLILKTLNAANPYVNGTGRYIDFTHEISFVDISLDYLLKALDFENVTIKGTDIYIFGGPVNFLAKVIAWLICKRLYLVSWLFGRKSIKIFEKDLIAIAYK
jgi:2-polyprenyl-3-methyl-5-hydroxy-6-metoxy-1,4-benzoquinol methylase